MKIWRKILLTAARTSGLFLTAILFCGSATGTVYAETHSTIYRYDGPVFGGEKKRLPEETMVFGGKIVTLISSELRSIWVDKRSKYAETIIPYILEEIDQTPENASVIISDDDTGKQYERVLPLLESEETGSYWADDFSFPITVQNYHADFFLLGENKIQRNTDLMEYADLFLDYLGLPGDSYQITDIHWEGEVYEKGGQQCRNARAKGRKRLRNVSAKYAGTIELPPMQGSYYHCIYAEKPEDTAQLYPPEIRPEKEMADTVLTKYGDDRNQLIRESESIGKKAVKWLMEHLTVIRVSIFLVIAFLLLSAAVLRRRRKEGLKSA